MEISEEIKATKEIIETYSKQIDFLTTLKESCPDVYVCKRDRHNTKYISSSIKPTEVSITEDNQGNFSLLNVEFYTKILDTKVYLSSGYVPFSIYIGFSDSCGFFERPYWKSDLINKGIPQKLIGICEKHVQEMELLCKN